MTIIDGREGREPTGRRMNGDQDHQGRHIRFANDEWGIQKLRLYNRPRAIEQVGNWHTPK
ncbi:MAG: hypothetical protein JST42_08290 [Bacteroidetes bacterium]|nr:hypothetical protein [Bacteroidota bacterium]